MAKPLAKHENVTRHSDGQLLVSVNVPATESKANRRLIELLAEYFYLQINIRILGGLRSRRRLLEID